MSNNIVYLGTAGAVLLVAWVMLLTAALAHGGASRPMRVLAWAWALTGHALIVAAVASAVTQ